MTRPWRYYLLCAFRRPTEETALFSSQVRRSANDLLSCKLRLFSYFRSPVTASLLPFTLSSLRSSSPPHGIATEWTATQELAAILPKLCHWLPLSRSHFGQHVTAVPPQLPDYSGNAFPSPLSQVSATAGLPYRPEQGILRAPIAHLAHESQPSFLPPNFQGGQIMSNFPSAPAPVDPAGPLTFKSAEETALSTNTTHYLDPSNDSYSLPFQAMESLSKFFQQNGNTQSLDTSRIFDSATWEQTDVLSSLGFIDQVRPSNPTSPNEFSGLTGLLDRWNHGDGGL